MDWEMQQVTFSASKKVASISGKDGVTWRLWLWKTTVKSAKWWLKYVFDEAKIILTFDEFTTVLYQIEACLNSGPLVPLSLSPFGAPIVKSIIGGR